MDEIKVCAYCGTEYPSARPSCPLCGMNDAEAHRAREEAGFDADVPKAASGAPAQPAADG